MTTHSMKDLPPEIMTTHSMKDLPKSMNFRIVHSFNFCRPWALESNPPLALEVGSLSKSFEEVPRILTVLLPSILASFVGRTNPFKGVPKAFTGSTLRQLIILACGFFKELAS
ncbi:hypothetical protein M9H77_30022 [Catharanthus roseus]|uniref:Uncharacterized protein n=1 Tax=Catharanthus roseus TaxID=4058 RepID=A0ACB9ZXY8_CATRO|nr:hypothetical protein M9H77_30022 [Catharanthus roseus]